MRGLFLDLSTKVGWAFFKGPSHQPEFGTKPLPRADQENYAGRTLPLRKWMRGMVNDWRPQVIGFESPFVPINHFRKPKPGEQHPRSFNTTQHAVRLQISLAAEIETTAA